MTVSEHFECLTLLVTRSRYYWMAGEQKSQMLNRRCIEIHQLIQSPIYQSSQFKGRTTDFFDTSRWCILNPNPHPFPPVRVQCRHPQTPVSKKEVFVTTWKRRLDTRPELGDVTGTKKPLPPYMEVIILAQAMHYYNGNPQNCHTFAVFDPKWEI